jgi:NADPH:quinone reductase
MRAAVLSTYGDRPAVHDLPMPAPGPSDVLVAVEAASINPLDFLIGSGSFYAMRPDLPYVVCREGVGQVVDPGSGQPIGQHKYFRIATTAGGAAAQYACVPRELLEDVPAPLSAATAAALGLAGTAAFLALRATGEFLPGERVVVLGASGAVGLLAAQLATALGASRVVAVSRTAVGLPYAVSSSRLVNVATDTVTDAAVGSDRWLAEVTSTIAAAADGAIDLVIDPVWGAPAIAALNALRPGGRLVNLGSSAGATIGLPSALVRGRSLRILGHTNAAFSDQFAEAYRTVTDFAAKGDLWLPIETFPLEAAADAWARATQLPRTKVILLTEPAAEVFR